MLQLKISTYKHKKIQVVKLKFCVVNWKFCVQSRNFKMNVEILC